MRPGAAPDGTDHRPLRGCETSPRTRALPERAPRRGPGVSFGDRLAHTAQDVTQFASPERFDHVRDSRGVPGVGAVPLPNLRKSEATKDGDGPKRSDRPKSRRSVCSSESFNGLIPPPSHARPAVVRLDVKLADFGAVKIGPADHADSRIASVSRRGPRTCRRPWLDESHSLRGRDVAFVRMLTVRCGRAPGEPPERPASRPPADTKGSQRDQRVRAREVSRKTRTMRCPLRRRQTDAPPLPRSAASGRVAGDGRDARSGRFAEAPAGSSSRTTAPHGL